VLYPVSKLSIALLGPNIEHRESLQEMLANTDSKVVWIPDSLSFLSNHEMAKNGFLPRMFETVLGTSSKDYLEHALELIDSHSVETVVGYWGSIPFADLIAIKKRRPHLKVVIYLLCFPLSLNSTGIRKQLFGLNNLARYLNGVIYPSMAMANYLTNKIALLKKIESVIIPPAWSTNFFDDLTSDEDLELPNVVFLGRTDLSGKTIHPADDIRSIMIELMDAGIHLHHSYSPETQDNRPYRHLFESKPIKPLMKFVSRFSASLIVYNLSKCGDTARFENTIPDRLLSSVAAGLPIAIPESGYSGCKAYLENYGATYVFRDSAHLKLLLSDAGRTRDFKQVAAVNRLQFTAAKMGKELLPFLSKL
jgi:hypothetical protein